MGTIKLLQAADLHVRDRDIEEIEKCLAKIVDTARDESVDLIVLCGDTFDSQDIKMDSKSARLVVKTVSEMADICPVAIISGTPTHEGKAPEILRFARGKHPIKVASVPDQWRALIGGQEIIITMMPQPTKQFFQTAAGIEASDREIGSAMSALFAGYGAKAAQHPGLTHILIYHGCISGGKASNNQAMTGRDIEINRDQLALSGASLILCGHLHLPQELPGSIFYSGSIYATDIGEDHEHGFYIHLLERGIALNEDHERVHAVSTFIETPCKRLLRYAFDYTDPAALPALDANAEDVAGATVRIDAIVWQDEAKKYDFDAMKTNLLRWGAESVEIKISIQPRVNVRAESVLAATTLRAEVEELAKLREETIDPDVLVKADLLELTPGDELLQRIAGPSL